MFQESNLDRFNDNKSTKVFQTFHGCQNRVIRFPQNVCHSPENCYNKQKRSIIKYRKFKIFPMMLFSKISKSCQNLIMKNTFQSAR